MARVPKIKKWNEANDYLLNLRQTIVGDILPLLNTGGAAPFAISREIMSYIDHLGHLYSGKGPVGDRSRKFLKEIMSKIDQNYSKRAKEIYKMYRCGTVHEFEPQTLKNNKGNLLSWLCYKGERIDKITISDKVFEVQHLQSRNSDNDNLFWLPISTKCLIQDTIESINIFIKSGPEDERVTLWNITSDELSKPVLLDFKL